MISVGPTDGRTHLSVPWAHSRGTFKNVCRMFFKKIIVGHTYNRFNGPTEGGTHCGSRGPTLSGLVGPTVGPACGAHVIASHGSHMWSHMP